MSWKESALVFPHVCLGRIKDTSDLRKSEKKTFSCHFPDVDGLVLSDASLL